KPPVRRRHQPGRQPGGCDLGELLVGNCGKVLGQLGGSHRDRGRRGALPGGRFGGPVPGGSNGCRTAAGREAYTHDQEKTAQQPPHASSPSRPVTLLVASVMNPSFFRYSVACTGVPTAKSPERLASSLL